MKFWEKSLRWALKTKIFFFPHQIKQMARTWPQFSVQASTREASRFWVHENECLFQWEKMDSYKRAVQTKEKLKFHSFFFFLSWWATNSLLLRMAPPHLASRNPMHIYLFIFGHGGIWEFSSPTIDQTRAPYIGSTETEPLDLEGSPSLAS